MLLQTTIVQGCLLGFAALMLWAALSDVRSLTIPNRISLAILLLYPAYVLASGLTVNWTGGLIVGGALLAAGFVLFAFGMLGGGDAKLVAAGGLWAGPDLLFDYLLLTAFAGGVMAVALWLHHRYTKATVPSLIFSTAADADFAKRPMPYAVAIAAGALYVAFTNLGIG